MHKPQEAERRILRLSEGRAELVRAMPSVSEIYEVKAANTKQGEATEIQTTTI